jgi:hypothetical protein
MQQLRKPNLTGDDIMRPKRVLQSGGIANQQSTSLMIAPELQCGEFLDQLSDR